MKYLSILSVLVGASAFLDYNFFSPLNEGNSFQLGNVIEKVFSAKKPLQSNKDDTTIWSNTIQIKELSDYSLRVREPKLCVDQNETTLSGYLDVNDDKHFFFWFFESLSKNKSDDIILWLNGGPGCSSMLGLLMELGPCRATKNGEGTVKNPHSWHNNANVIFLDQPLNVGYSYGKNPVSSYAAGIDVFAFLQLFKRLFPEYNGRIHVFGESYAGHYVPAIAKAITENSKAYNLPEIDLASIGIGNGLVDPLIQYNYYAQMACNSSYPPVLSQDKCNQIDSHYKTCGSLIEKCYKNPGRWTCVPPSYYCNNYMLAPYFNERLNPYDVRTPCKGNDLCYPIIGDIEKYLNRKDVMKELGADVDSFTSCNTQVYQGFLFDGDWMKPYMNEIPALLHKGIRTLIYAGDADWICNWYGNKAWTLALPWNNTKEFNAQPDLPWNVLQNINGTTTPVNAGEIRSFGELTFLRVFQAGHMVPYDQPENSLDMINRWIKHTKGEKF